MLFIGFPVISSHAGIYESLKDEDQKAVQAGKQVIEFSSVKDSHWPNAKVYQRVNSTPLEAAAVLFDFKNYQVAKFHRISKSEVVPTIGVPPNQVTVDYTLGISWPISMFFSNTDYRVLNWFSCDSKGTHLKWELAPNGSTFLKDIHGEATFEPLGTGTLIAYENYVEPASSKMNNSLVISGIKRGSWKALTSIVNRIEFLKQNDHALLEVEVEALTNALSLSGMPPC